ncbi:unnamed protein product [Darwinula stevensoni]|uniref:Uncharacterized protein n=1 Tax=Darwinula stevensoni TaxID=69355 RepID=A0A7R8XDW9_9CRUS|nr:unnamed protein product [Darwinula stevensoni]CAG0895197.1 unnamed protein product [Darwinula stevensoni]
MFQEQHKQESQRTRSMQREELFAEGWKTAHLFREKKEVEKEEEEVEEEEEEEEVEENEKYEFEMKGSVFGIKEPNEGEFKNLMEFFKHSRNYREERQKNSEEELIPEGRLLMVSFCVPHPWERGLENWRDTTMSREQHKQESQRTRSRQREELFAEGWKTAHLFREKKEVEEEEEEVEEEEEEEEEEEVEENEKYEFEMKGSVFGIKEPNEGEFKNLMEFFKHSRNYREERQKNSEEELIPEVAKAAAMDARREEECTELFGPHAPKIMGMEASLQSFFNQLCDETGAKAWPKVWSTSIIGRFLLIFVIKREECSSPIFSLTIISSVELMVILRPRRFNQNVTAYRIRFWLHARSHIRIPRPVMRRKTTSFGSGFPTRLGCTKHPIR